MTHHGHSGRIVIDVDPTLKRGLYSALALSGSTLKEWFVREAATYTDEISQTNLFSRNVDTEPSNIIDSSQESAAPLYKSASEECGKLSIRKRAKYSAVSMFSGCGGMDLGFTGGFKIFGRNYEELPFDIVWANDINSAACSTYKRNIGKEIHCGDVWKALRTLPKKADVLIGGFPCQDISVNGKRAGANGARSGLYRAMVEAIKRVQPKVFVAENVKGLLLKYNVDSLKQVLGDFEGLGYKVHFQLYCAADYGVPQTRERVFFVGTAKGLDPFLPPRPERSAAKWMTAKQAIGDLESLERSEDLNHVWSHANKSPEQGNRRLLPQRAAYTIRAECHGNIQFHYKHPRRISMRDAARIQSFPDNFIFESGLRQIERQVGNAVPPILAWHIAKSILRCLESKSNQPE
jgi:DNA (cytosine-5)-methyltransferase 1